MHSNILILIQLAWLISKLVAVPLPEDSPNVTDAISTADFLQIFQHLNATFGGIPTRHAALYDNSKAVITHEDPIAYGDTGCVQPSVFPPIMADCFSLLDTLTDSLGISIEGSVTVASMGCVQLQYGTCMSSVCNYRYVYR